MAYWSRFRKRKREWERRWRPDDGNSNEDRVRMVESGGSTAEGRPRHCRNPKLLACSARQRKQKLWTKKNRFRDCIYIRIRVKERRVPCNCHDTACWPLHLHGGLFQQAPFPQGIFSFPKKPHNRLQSTVCPLIYRQRVYKVWITNS